MKAPLIALIFLLFAGLNYFNETIDPPTVQTTSAKREYHQGILRNELSKLDLTANYAINVELLTKEKLIKAEEKIIWINKTDSSADEIRMHFYPNAFKNRKTFFMDGKEIPFESRSEMRINEFSIQDKDLNPEYAVFSGNIFDSTVAVIKLPQTAFPGDTVTVYIKFKVPIPKSISRSGYSVEENFYFISQWFPKVGVYQDGKWICDPFYPNTEFFSDFGNYSVNITVPENFIVAATGVMVDSVHVGSGKIRYAFNQYGVHDFAWMASDKVLFAQRDFKRKDNSIVEIKAYIQPNNYRYLERYLTAVENSLRYFEEFVGVYPYQTLSLVDVPRTSRSGGMEYPTLFTVKANLFSPVEMHAPEGVTIHEFAHQFFYGLLANNEVTEAWLDEGFAAYFTNRILYHYYGEPLLSFKVFKHYPVFGLELLSYKDVPLIYTITKIPIAKGTIDQFSYYENPKLGAIADTSHNHLNRELYGINSYSKPALMLQTLENYLGTDQMNRIIKLYFERFKFKHPTTKDFISVVNEVSGGNMSWFFDNMYRRSFTFDYVIKSIEKVERSNVYEVLAVRNEDGVFPQDVFLYTDRDTLHQFWDGKDRWKKLRFETSNKVLGAELDPFRVNLLELNYANNSFMVDPNYKGSLRLSIVWFFWLQNLLLIFGGLA